MDRPSVIVVGGGLAGLATASRLRARGCQVTLLERSERLGGRATSDTRDGYCLDSGPHVIGARDTHLLGLIDRVGLASRLLPLRPTGLAQIHGGAPRTVDPTGLGGVARLPGVRLLQALRLRRLGRQLREFGDLLDPSRPEAAVRLDDRSIGDFVRLYFGDSVLAHWAEPFCGADTLSDAEQTSRVLFLLQYVSRRFAPIGTLRAGLAELAAGLADPSDRLGTELRALRARGDRIVAEIADPGGEQELEADAVVCAIRAGQTCQTAAPLLAPAEIDFLAAARYAPSIVLAAALQRSLVGKVLRVRVPASEGWPVASLAIEPGSEDGVRAPAGTELALVTARPEWSAANLEAPDEVIAKELLGYLQRTFPGASGAVRFTSLRRYREALPCFPVGRYRQIAAFRKLQGELRRAGRRLYFAGDHLIGPTLEAAVTSGVRAADELCADLGTA